MTSIVCAGVAQYSGIATRYGLRGPGIEFRWGVGPIFSASDQTGSGVDPAFCTTGTGPFPGVKCGRGVALITHRIWRLCGLLQGELYDVDCSIN